MRPGQEWGPFLLEILDALDFPRQLAEAEEKGGSRGGAKLAEGRGPREGGPGGCEGGPLAWQQHLGSRMGCSRPSCGHKIEAEPGFEFSQTDI